MNKPTADLRTKIARQATAMARTIDGNVAVVWLHPLEIFNPSSGEIYLEQRAHLVLIPDDAKPPFGKLLQEGKIKVVANLEAHSVHEPNNPRRIVTPAEHVIQARRSGNGRMRR